MNTKGAYNRTIEILQQAISKLQTLEDETQRKADNNFYQGSPKMGNKQEEDAMEIKNIKRQLETLLNTTTLN